MAKTFSFGTKAETLAALEGRVQRSVVPEFFFFTVSAWREDPEAWLDRAQKQFKDAQVIVRSSASAEDGSTSAHAGVHDSVAHINANDRASLRLAIGTVEKSYERFGQASPALDQVIVQRMVAGVSMSGVVFTQDMITGAPYFVINYDDQTGLTDTVTAGGQYSNRTLYVQRSAVSSLRSARFRLLLEAVLEVEALTELNSVDIEFAVTSDNRVMLFQVRRITTQPNWNRAITLKVNDAVERIKEFLTAKMRVLPNIHGERTLFGQMPDWNPAEMIGSAPRPLALSLYRKLITDETWRKARRLMGYQEPRGAPLLCSIGGRPYIDVRMSFNSFLPVDLKPQISETLVGAWIERLSAQKELHDKVEFEVAVTSFAFDFDKMFTQRYPGLLQAGQVAEFRGAVKGLTENLVKGKVASIGEQLAKVEELKSRQAARSAGGGGDSLLQANALLEECVELGTLPFSILARHGFVAKSFLRSMISEGTISEKEALDLQSTVGSVTTLFIRDIRETLEGRMPRAEFLRQYGHLRPGTYDILSQRYDQKTDFFDSLKSDRAHADERAAPALSEDSSRRLEESIKRNGLSFSSAELIAYIKAAISAREYSKFIFSKNISDALEIVAKWGERMGLSREELSYIPIQDLLDGEVSASGRSLEHHLRGIAQRGMEEHELTCALHLPQLIEQPEDACIVPLLLSRPNFITRKAVSGDFEFLNGYEAPVHSLADKIILIESADPGFDWIFSHKIAGLVTKYGGVNSHMAVRCAEFGIPAAIGCGEQIFDRLVKSRQIEIDCASGRVVPTED